MKNLIARLIVAALLPAVLAPDTLTAPDDLKREGIRLPLVPRMTDDPARTSAPSSSRRTPGRATSSSEKALRRVTAAAEEGPLHESVDYRYMRTILPAGSEEAVFAFLSDEFLRRLVGPRLRILESRRMRCASHLRTLVNASLLRHAEEGGGVATIRELLEKAYVEEHIVRCPHGGEYTFAPTGEPCCSVHGRLGRLTPHIELSLEEATEAEASAYRRFARSYGNFWRRYFDPVGISATRDGGSWEAEMVVLPMADNSLYRNLTAYALFPVRDRAKAEEFLEGLRQGVLKESRLPQEGRFSLKHDVCALDGGEIAAFTLSFHSFKMRLFCTLRDEALIVATRADTLRKIVAAESDPFNVRTSLFPGRWNRLRPDMLLGFEESARTVCTQNLALLQPLAAKDTDPARRLGFAPECPDGGRICCSLHGSSTRPVQLAAPAEANTVSHILHDLDCVTISLRFTDEGICTKIRLKR